VLLLPSTVLLVLVQVWLLLSLPLYVACTRYPKRTEFDVSIGLQW
jgi:hypothetical protein